MPRNGSWHALFPYRKKAFLPSSPFSFAFPPRWGEVSPKGEPRSYLDRVYNQGIPGHLNRGHHPANHLNLTKGGLLDLAVSSVTGELLGFLNKVSRLYISLVFLLHKINFILRVIHSYAVV